MPLSMANSTSMLARALICWCRWHGGEQVRREHYLRDDIHSGTPLDPASDPAANKLAPDARHYLVVDTNVALSQVGRLHAGLHHHVGVHHGEGHGPSASWGSQGALSRQAVL